MNVYDREGNLLENYDLELGRLEGRVKTLQHPAVEEVREQGHYETVRTYPNGGRDVAWVVDVPGVQAQEAWVEEIPYQVYIPDTQEELDAIAAERNKPTDEERIAVLEEELLAAKILLGLEV